MRNQSQQKNHQVHTHSHYAQCGTGQWEPTEQAPSAHTFALRTMRHRAMGANRTEQVPSAHTFAFTHNAAQDNGSQQNKHQVHTHSQLRTMRHRAIKPASKSAAKALINPKIEKPQAKILVNLYKV